MSDLHRICERLKIHDVRYVEIEAKKRVVPEQAKRLRKHLMSARRIKHVKRVIFFDQYLDTPGFALLKAGASLRIRYKNGGANVYLQYKGPGFHQDGLLFRSEFSTERLTRLVREESHHDMVQFADTKIPRLLRENLSDEMRSVMTLHLGRKTLERISVSPILASYEKDKFLVELGKAFLEPSLDHLFAWHISPRGLHSLSTFWEYENEIKADEDDLVEKLEHLPALEKFDRDLGKRFDLRPEKLDKYHRCASYFIK